MSRAVAEAIYAWQQIPAPKPACLLLLRHGTTQWNEEFRLQGQTDVPLNAIGHTQAREVAGVLQDVPDIRAVYSSPLQRASVTALGIAENAGLKVQFDEGLLERGLGALEGLTRQEREEKYPRRKWSEQEVPGVETWDALLERAVNTITRLAGLHRGEIVTIVSHGALLNAFLHYASAGRVGTGVTNLANAGITVAWLTNHGWHIAAINLVDHLSSVIGQTVQPDKKHQVS